MATSIRFFKARELCNNCEYCYKLVVIRDSYEEKVLIEIYDNSNKLKYICKTSFNQVIEVNKYIKDF